MILSDRDIRALCLEHNPPMITPFSEGVQGGGVISYGLSSSGYDIRLAGYDHNVGGSEIRIFKRSLCEVIDPKRFGSPEYQNRVFEKVRLTDGPVSIPPNGYILGMSMETFSIPENIQGQCLGKSTYCRCGLIVNVSPLEPAWKGTLTVEISNPTDCVGTVYLNEGCAQIVFHQLSSIPEKTYASKGGKYMNQSGVTPARVL